MIPLRLTLRGVSAFQLAVIVGLISLLAVVTFPRGHANGADAALADAGPSAASTTGTAVGDPGPISRARADGARG